MLGARRVFGNGIFGGAAPMYTISGTVTDGINPISGVTVALGALTATTIADGTYTINSIPPNTSGTLTASKSGYLFIPNISIAAMSGNLTGKNFAAWADTLINMYFDDATNWYQDAAMTTPAVADGDPVGGIPTLITTHVLSGVTTARPTLKTNIINGLRVLRFDGVANVLATAGAIFNSSSHQSVFVMVIPRKIAIQQGVFGTPGRDVSFAFHGATLEGYQFYDSNGDITNVYNQNVFTKDQATILTAWKSAGVWYFRRNGTQLAETPVDPGSAHNNNGFGIGNNFGTTTGWFGQNDIAALATVKGELTLGQVQTLEAYWAARYGVSLP